MSKVYWVVMVFCLIAQHCVAKDKLVPIDTLQYETCPKCGDCLPSKVAQHFYKNTNDLPHDTTFCNNGNMWMCQHGSPGGGSVQRVDMTKCFYVSLNPKKRVIVWCYRVRKVTK